MKPLNKRLWSYTATTLATLQLLSCGDDPFDAGRENIMGQSTSLDRPMLQTTVTKNQEPAKTEDAARTYGLYPGAKVGAAPTLGSLPYYCNPLRYPGNIINSAGNCRPFLDNLGSLVPQPTYDLVGLGLSSPALVAVPGDAFPIDGGPFGGAIDDGAFDGPFDGGLNDGAFNGPFDGGLIDDGAFDGPFDGGGPLEDGFIGDDGHDGGDFPFWGPGEGRHHKRKHRRCCGRGDDDHHSDDDEGDCKKRGKKKIIKRHR